MTARTTMATLITKTRTLSGDTGTAVFTDDQHQDALDRFRSYVQLARLAPIPTIASGGTVTFSKYVADFKKGGNWAWGMKYDPLGDWEDTVVIQDGTYATITISSINKNLLNGEWTLTTAQNPPMYLTGYTYDVYASAAHICEEWAGVEQLNYDHTWNFAQYKESQKAAVLMARAGRLRSMQRLRFIPMHRSDVNPNLHTESAGDLVIDQMVDRLRGNW